MRLTRSARVSCVRKWRVARIPRQYIDTAASWIAGSNHQEHCGETVMNIARMRWALAAAATLTVGAAAARDADGFRHKWPDFRIVNLSSLGGNENAGNSINDQNLIAGFANLPDNNSRHAMLWLYGFRFDLDTLGGPNSNVPWPVKNTNGLIAGIAQTTKPQPEGETWSCRSFFALPTRAVATCLGVVWEEGKIRALPTLGGDNGFATGANNHRQVVGWAENRVKDPTCVLPQIYQFRATLWGPDFDRVRELPPLPGDSTSAATGINDKGQVIGISGACGTAVGGVAARHAVLWEKGKPIHLGNLGGIAWNTAMALNERGDVVGFSNFSKEDGAVFNARAFLWTRGRGIQDLGTLPGDSLSQALGINERRQIVGLSCTAGFASCRAFLWEHGVMRDLNDFVPEDYADHLYTANDINNNGHITGYTIKAGTEDALAFWALPIDERGHRHATAAKGRNKPQRVPLPEQARQQILVRAFAAEAQLAR
jgi:probable HAF family extracellular repeat protein